MAIVPGSGPVELRVLSALTSGASTVLGVAAEVGEPESVVEPILEWSVAEQRVARLDLPGLPTYALTPKGLALLDFSQETQRGAVDGAGGVDLAQAVQSPVEQPEPAEGVPAEEPQSGSAEGVVEPAPVAPSGIGPGTASGGTSVSTDPAPAPKVRRRHVAYAAGYVVVGLLLLAVTPILGALAVVAGLVLGGYALLPLFASSSTRVNGP